MLKQPGSLPRNGKSSFSKITSRGIKPMTNPLTIMQMVARAVQQAQNGKLAITVRNVAMFLPGPTAFDPKLKAMRVFELDADDLGTVSARADP